MNPLTRLLRGPEDHIRAPFEEQIQNFNRCRLVGLWRSPLELAIRRLGPNRAPSAQWKGLIESTVQAGVSGTEIDINGILQMLEWDDPERLVERGEILDYLDEAGLKIQVMQERGWTGGRPWFFLASDERPERFHTTLRNDEPFRTRYGMQIDRAGLFDPPEQQGRWVARFRRPGQHEVATICTAEDPTAAGQWCHGVGWCLGNIGCGSSGRYGHLALSGGANYREILFVIPAAWPPFDQSHFPVRNVLCHLRLTDRIGDDGVGWLHIEEIQSDWHKPQHGYPGPPLKKQWLKIALGWCVQEALERGLEGVSLSGGDIQVSRSMRGRVQGLKNLYARAEKVLAQVAAIAGGTPSEAVFHCQEKRRLSILPLKNRNDAMNTTWCLAAPGGHVLLHGIPTAREAARIRRRWMIGGPVKVPAVRFQRAADHGWQRPFFRLDHEAIQQATTRPAVNARGRKDSGRRQTAATRADEGDHKQAAAGSEAT